MPVTFHDDDSVSGTAYARGFGLSYRDNDHAAALPEDPQIPEAYRSAPGSLYHAAHPTAPWSIFLADAGPAQVHLTTPRLTSPQGGVSVEETPEGNKIIWSGRHEGQFQISGRAHDFRAPASDGMALQFKYRVDRAADQPVSLAVLCSEALCGTAHGARLDISPLLRDAPLHQWHSETVALSCFSRVGADLSAVEMPFVIATHGSLELTISEVSLRKTAVTESRPCPASP
jgi:beta-glucosidase